MNPLQSSLMVHLYWSLLEARDREYGIYEYFMGVKNIYLVAHCTYTAQYTPREHKFLWKLQGNISSYKGSVVE
jgi:hypothetical protein